MVAGAEATGAPVRAPVLDRSAWFTPPPGAPGEPARGRQGSPLRDGHPAVRVAIIGLGAWGLAVLERLMSTAERQGARCGRLEIHVVEPNPPGFGVYSTDLPDYVIMNTPCGQISMHPGLEQGPSRPYQLSLLEWARAEGYNWHGDLCLTVPGGRELTEHDFVPRALVGRYLQWYFEGLVAAAPPSVMVRHHRTQALDVVREARGERVLLACGESLDVDDVILTVGHARNQAEGDRVPQVPYDEVFAPGFDVAPGAQVVVAGMGLAATDVVMALTRGRGGRFVPEGNGLRYLPSGREPSLRLYSRSGLPQCAKAVGMRDITTTYRPGIWTEERVSALKAAAASGRRRGLNWDRDLYPLLAGEMTLQYYVQASLNLDGPEASRETREQLLRAWSAGSMPEEVARLSTRLGHFDPADHLYPNCEAALRDTRAYHQFVRQLMVTDLGEALRPGGSSPVKMAYEVLRFVRDGIRGAVDFGGLDVDSHLQFFGEVRGRINRLVQGPPAQRLQQLLALVDAGILRYPYGPHPIACSRSDGRIQLESTQLKFTQRDVADMVIAGYITDPDISCTGSRLLANLRDGGRVKPMQIDGRSVGSVQLTPDGHPIARDGTVQERLWLFGAVTEGARYFTNVIPSPGSRVGPFREAARLAETILQPR